MNENQTFLTVKKPHFNLRNPKGDKPSQVYLIINIGKQYKISTGVKVLPHHWDNKKQSAMVSPSLSVLDNRNNSLVNSKILDYSLRYMKLIDYLCNHIDEIESPTSAISSIFDMRKKATENDIKVYKAVLEGLRKKNIADSTFTLYKRQIKEFCDWQKDMTVSMVNMKLMMNYREYLHKQKVIHKVLGTEVYIEDNTVNAKLKNVLSLLGYIEGFDTTQINKIKKELKDAPTFENAVYLTSEELEKIEKIELKGKEDECRDLFLFQVSSGQRISDIMPLMGIDMRDKIEKSICTIVQKKTKARVSFPLNEAAMKIIEKYNYVLPKQSDHTIDKVIKTVAQKCGITRKCECRETRNRTEFVYTVEAWQLVGTHTARRSFISQAILDGHDSSLIKKVSGHKTDSAFEKYNRVSTEVAAEVMLKMNKKGAVEAQETAIPETKTNVVGNDKVNEYRCVLSMLEVPSYKWLEETDIENLFRMVFKAEEEYSEKYGIEYQDLKVLFGSSLSLEEKHNRLEEMKK